MGILDQSINCNCTNSTTCNTTCEPTINTSSSVVSGPSGASGSSGPSGPSPTPDSGYCCNITPQSSIDAIEQRRRRRRRGR